MPYKYTVFLKGGRAIPFDSATELLGFAAADWTYQYPALAHDLEAIARRGPLATLLQFFARLVGRVA